VKTRSNPDSVRGPDISYYSYERLPKGDVPDGLLTVAPDLVVEVRSPSDGWIELFVKALEYLQTGVRVVIVLDASNCLASVHRPKELPRLFHNGDELVVPDVLLGFSVSVRRLFE
jgi:Uma2 family endonuclease